MILQQTFIVGKELSYIAQAVLVESRTAGDGSFTKKCHEWLEKRLVAKALLTHSCTAALEMSAILCDIGQGDEVIMLHSPLFRQQMRLSFEEEFPCLLIYARTRLTLTSAQLKRPSLQRQKQSFPFTTPENHAKWTDHGSGYKT